ncbi:hypothetical protein [Streptosporangium sp. NPDC004631]
MTMPQVWCEIAFARDSADSSPLWRDVSADVEWWLGVRISRRRSHELDEVQPGTLHLVLTNEDGRYTAGNTSSPHYPNVRINRPIRLRARWPVSVNLLLEGQARASTTTLFSSSAGSIAVDTVVVPAGQTSSIRWDTGALAAPDHYLRVGTVSGDTATSQAIPVTAGTVYTLSCRARRDASLALSANARIRWYDGSGAFLSDTGGSAVALSTSFQALAVTGTAPAGAVWARQVIGTTTTAASSVAVYVSALQFERAAAASTWTSPGVEYIRYTGFVDRWPHAWTGGVLGYAALTATDRQKLLGRQLLGAVALTDNQLSGGRANALLAAAGITSTLVDPGLSVLGLTGDEARQSIQALLRAVARSEAGLFFISGDGGAVFQDRGRRQRPATTVLTVTADQCRDDLNFVVDDALLINDATVLTNTGLESTRTDAASIDDYGTYSTRLDTLLTNTAEAADRASFLLAKYAEPSPRAGQISIEARTQPTLWEELLGSEIGQRIQVTNLPGSAPSGVLDLWIEGVQDEITDQSWTFTLDPSPAAVTISFILDDPTYGTLDNNKLGW